MGAYPRRSWKERKETMKWVFGLFPRLEERAGQLARTLSGGEQQMLAMGRGLMSKPKMVLVDEPSKRSGAEGGHGGVRNPENATCPRDHHPPRGAERAPDVDDCDRAYVLGERPARPRRRLLVPEGRAIT